MAKKNLCLIEGQLLFTHIQEPTHVPWRNQEVYNVCLRIKKGAPELTNLMEQLNRFYLENLAVYCQNNGTPLPFDALNLPVKDGDQSKSDYLHGCMYLNADSYSLPMLINSRKEALDPSEIHDGIYARLVLTLSPYCFPDNAGISCHLGGIMKLHEGTLFEDKEEITVDDFFGDDDAIEDVDDSPAAEAPDNTPDWQQFM